MTGYLSVTATPNQAMQQTPKAFGVADVVSPQTVMP